MTFRRQPANPNPYPFAAQPQQQSQSPVDDTVTAAAGAPVTASRKRPRAASDVGDPAAVSGDPFQHENGSDASDASDEGGGKPDKKAGRRKIKIEFIQDKSRRHITFSKRKAGIMKKAYELSTLTGTQVLLLVVSETGLVYTFTTAKLQPLVTQPEGKNLIQACLNAPHGNMSNNVPVSNNTPMNRNTMSGGSSSNNTRSNVPGGLAISPDKENDADAAGDEDNAQRGSDDQQQQQHQQQQQQPQHTDNRAAHVHVRRPSTTSDAHSPTEKSPTQTTRKPPPTASAPPPPPNAANPGALSGGGMPQYPYGGLAGVGIDPSMYQQHPTHYMGGPATHGGYGAPPGGQAPGGQWAQPGGYARR